MMLCSHDVVQTDKLQAVLNRTTVWTGSLYLKSLCVGLREGLEVGPSVSWYIISNIPVLVWLPPFSNKISSRPSKLDLDLGLLVLKTIL